MSQKAASMIQPAEGAILNFFGASRILWWYSTDYLVLRQEMIHPALVASDYVAQEIVALTFISQLSVNIHHLPFQFLSGNPLRPQLSVSEISNYHL
jgi:hypothetical protein